MSNTIIDETIIETTVDETIINTTINETIIKTELSEVIGIGGSFMLDDGTKVTVIEATDPNPAITQTKELLIRKNS